MASLMRDGFVGFDTLTLTWLDRDTAVFEGRIACAGRIVVDVAKSLERVAGGTDDDPLIQTVRYSYNAFVQGYGNILRYDNAHLHDGHGDPHHKHSFNWETRQEQPDSPIWIGADKWPTLGQVLHELRDWYYENRSSLPSEDYPREEHLR